MAFSTIDKGSLHMNPVLYESNGTAIGSGGLTVTGFDFQPDWLGLKQRDADESWGTYDAVRGTTKSMRFNGTEAEDTRTEGVTAFNSNGFTCGSDSRINPSGTHPMVSYGWKAGGSTSPNTVGTIESTVSVNTTAGFSIATWTGVTGAGTMGHGLGGVDCIITKNTNSARDWYWWNSSMAYTTRLEMNNTEAFTTGTDNMTQLPDATKIYWDDSTQNNGTGEEYVGYFFQEIPGYSKFSNYTGNGNSDGTFVYTGFKPSFVMAKRTDSTDDWMLYDDAISTYNQTTYAMRPNVGNGEQSGNYIDMLSNGFKIRISGASLNASGGSYVYMAFGQPIISNSGVCATAR